MAAHALPQWSGDAVSSARNAPPPRLELVARATFSELEWSIVAMAGSDSLASLREPNRFWAIVGAIFGLRPANRLASDRLEALRRVAVLTWSHRGSVPNFEVKAFLGAGFSPAQLELLQDTIVELRTGPSRGGKR